MRGVNKAILIGTLGHDVELRKARKEGSAVVNLRVCTNTRWRDRQTGENREQTEWHSVVLFGKMAEFVAKNAKRGTRVYVEGHLQTRRRTMRNGQERAYTEIVARELQLLRDRFGDDEASDKASGEANGNVRSGNGKGDYEAPL